MIRVRSFVRLANLAWFAFLLTSCGGGPSDDGGGGVTPRFAVATQGRAPFENDVELCPSALRFSVFLEPAGSGWVSLEHQRFGSELVEVTWTRSQNGTFVVNAPLVQVPFDREGTSSSEVGWENLSFQIDDEDEDGTGETGQATATLICDWEESQILRTETYVSTFDLAVRAGIAEVGFSNSSGLGPIYTFADAVDASSSKPMLTDTLSGFRLLVDGTPIAATVTLLDESGPFVSVIRLDPVDPLPFDADLALDPGPATDAFGNPVEFSGLVQHTVTDPGPLTDNPSFDGDGGWIGLHTITAGDPFDGPAYAIVGRSSDLVGYFDVPADAVSFAIVVSADDYNEECSSANVYLQTSAARLGLFPDTSGDDECMDYPEGCSIPWTRSSVNLRDLRGQRVVVRATADRFTSCRPDIVGDLYLDDARIQ